jgi:hypothetical protein
MVTERVTDGGYHCSFGVIKGGMGAEGQVIPGRSGHPPRDTGTERPDRWSVDLGLQGRPVPGYRLGG